MPIRKIYEPELDGISVIIWEGGKGTRIVYPTERQAETAAEWLLTQANRFHEASVKNEDDWNENERMISIIVYGDQPMTEFQFVRNYFDRMRRAGYEVLAGLTRETKEFW